MRLNLGCGCFLFPAPWINIDYSTTIAVPKGCTFRLQDLRRGLGFDSESVDLIYCAHTLDHLDIGKAEELLAECHRVMKKNSLARFAVMDFPAILEAYLMDDIDSFAKHQPAAWAGYKSPVLKLSLFLLGSMSGEERYTGHWWFADWDGIRELCRRAGFADIKRMEFGQSQSKVIQMETQDMYPDHTLFFEVKKY